MNTNEEKKIVFNIPLNLNVSKEFPEFSIKDLPKVECLVNQINYLDNGRGYQVHIKKHAWSYCLSNGEVGLILKRLVSLGIIKKVGENVPGAYSNAYQMVKRYNNEDSQKSYYQVSDYLFMQKLQADKWVAMGKEHSKYVAPAKVTAKGDNSLAAAQARIKALEDLLMANGIAIPGLNMAKPCTALEAKPLLIIVPEPLAPVIIVSEPKPVQVTSGVSPVNKAKQLLEGLKANASTPKPVIKAVTDKATPTLNTDVYRSDNYTLVNHTRYTRATQLLTAIDRIMMERRLTHLLHEGYSGEEIYQAGEWGLTFNIDSSARQVTFLDLIADTVAA